MNPENTASVLLIEDHHDIADMVCEFMESQDYIMDYAADGVTGLHLAVTGEYDAIILDLMLPGMDGIALLEKLRNTDNVKLVFVVPKNVGAAFPVQRFKLLGVYGAGVDDTSPRQLDILTKYQESRLERRGRSSTRVSIGLVANPSRRTRKQSIQRAMVFS